MAMNATVEGLEGDGLMVRRQRPGEALTSISGSFQAAESVDSGEAGKLVRRPSLVYEGPLRDLDGEIRRVRLN